MLSALNKLDSNQLIANKQRALKKSFTSWKKGSALADANDLAWYFVAKGDHGWRWRRATRAGVIMAAGGGARLAPA